MAYTLYIHEPVDDLPGLARYGFPPETFFSTDLEWIVEDAIFESEQEGKRHVVIQAEAPDEILMVPDEDIENALEDKDEEEWEEVPEEEVRFEAGGTETFAEEFEEEAEEAEEIPEEDWPETLAEAVELTQSATLAGPLAPQNAVVLGEPVEIFQEDMTPEERKEERWFRFSIQPTPLVQFQLPFWKRILRELVTGR